MSRNPARPRILVFDSGLGGLTVFAPIAGARPDAELIYAADDAFFPYGELAEAALVTRVVSLMDEWVAAFAPDLVVIACNTASTLVIDALRETFPGHPFVGTVPAIKPAAERTRSGLVSVLATPGTVKRQYTRDLIGKWAQKCHVRLVGSTGLARLAETYMREGFVDEEAVRAEIAPCFVAEPGCASSSRCHGTKGQPRNLVGFSSARSR